ncbi:MAG: GNAT family N-acetyltransferase [Treponema sp.]|jgi:GNAT superfamily N-acetyltransferase|nr:GNAT family N-acetyltransferase [Treponema sp.]
MEFDLTDPLLDAILFAMEDQQGDFLMDTQEGVVVPRNAGCAAAPVEKQAPRENHEAAVRYLELPHWNSTDGYQLMERFTGKCKNALLRTALTGALDRGKGVFRAFKDTLHQYPEAEERWFSFKTREMKREILRWYNALRDAWGLERIGMEPEETGDLVLEDFIFWEPKIQDPAAAAELYRRIREAGTTTGGEEALIGDLILAVESGGGDFAGYIAAVKQGKTLSICALEVSAEYRGLGLGSALLSRLLDTLDPRNLSLVSIDLPVEAEGFSRVLLRNAFRPSVTRYCLPLPASYQHEHQETDKSKGYPDPSA